MVPAQLITMTPKKFQTHLEKFLISLHLGHATNICCRWKTNQCISNHWF